MHSGHVLLEEPIRMASILEPSRASFFPAMTKIVGTLGPKSRSVEVISGCLKAGMSVARFDFSWHDPEYHQETLENLKAAVKITKKLCAVMLDTVGPELQVVNKSEKAISLQEDATVILTPDEGQEPSSELLPINFDGLSKAVKKGDTIFIGQYLFTGSETTSVWLEVGEVQGNNVVCVIKNSATLTGSLFTLHASQIRIELPTLSDKDKEVISSWGVQNKIDFLSLSYTRHAEDVRQAREFLSKLGDLYQTQIFAKIENIEGLNHFDEILQEADGIILSRGNLGIDLPPEKEVMLFFLVLRPCVDCTLLKPFLLLAKFVQRLIAKYRPTMPVLSVVIPRLKTNQLRWSFSGAFEMQLIMPCSSRLKEEFVARQSLIVRGLFPMLADPRHPAESTSATNESVLKVALDHGKASGIIKSHDRVVVCQKVGDASVVKIIELED
ncbi:pyruvate kinase 1, cytosolic-like isoform X3 [Durio zibethinus]|uniref:Pyruvate kinase n=1 Tax=Durio zibethinus TaxID=66656 RepID=A0A6P5YXZ2_DURZI|nr:pyruvate kinase 1, cytosolic-like isoform X3 [Durio zibethinus]